jgi:hypothetical protein
MPTELQEPIRARRFCLRLPLRYRAAGERGWHRGITENVSCSGVLLRGRRIPQAASMLELLLPVPSELAGSAQLMVLCRGRIARVVQRRLPLFPSSVGIRVIDYELIGDWGTANRGSNAALRLPEVVHDLNNMLAVVIGGCELVLSDPEVSEITRHHVSSIHTAGQRSAQLVQRLASWGKS